EFTEQREKEKAERARKKAEAEVAEKTARERQPFTDAIKRPLPGGRLALQFDFHPGKFESRDAEWNCEWQSVWKSIGCGLSYKKLWQLTLITTPALAERYLTRDGKLSLHRFELTTARVKEARRLETLESFSCSMACEELSRRPFPRRLHPLFFQ